MFLWNLESKASRITFLSLKLNKCSNTIIVCIVSVVKSSYWQVMSVLIDMTDMVVKIKDWYVSPAN
jgi:hypothetical protein